MSASTGIEPVNMEAGRMPACLKLIEERRQATAEYDEARHQLREAKKEEDAAKITAAEAAVAAARARVLEVCTKLQAELRGAEMNFMAGWMPKIRQVTGESTKLHESVSSLGAEIARMRASAEAEDERIEPARRNLDTERRFFENWHVQEVNSTKAVVTRITEESR